jgi:antitoxin CptB
MATFDNINIMIEATRKAKIKWQCRRGMLELDLLLEQFIEHALDGLKDSQIKALEELLTLSDPTLYGWLMGHEKPSDKELLAIVEFIQMHNQAK